MKSLEVISQQARKSPEVTAVTCKKKHITYGELEDRSNELAERLRGHGFGKGKRAGIYLDRSIESIICMFATLKAGGAYVPLDSSQPIHRIAYILDDSEVSVLFSTKKKYGALVEESALPDTLATAILVAETNNDEALEVRQRRPSQAAAIHETDLALILYTSGSTGKPKGFQVTRQMVQVFIDWTLSEYNITNDDVFLNVAGFHFDLSLFDIYASLSRGARLVIFPQSSLFSPFAFGQAIVDHQITCLYCVPSILTLMITSSAIQHYKLDSLRYVIFAGEAFPVKHLRTWKALLPEINYYNVYGPAETIACTFYKIGDIDPERKIPMPIGNKMSNVDRLYALDVEGNTIEDGAPGTIGELFVQGPCVTPGYWKYEDRNNKDNHPQGIHATGDLVTFEDGHYVFQGRKDRQVQLRGNRVELPEIESVIMSYGNIDECAVIVVGEDDDLCLLAFIVGSAKLSADALKEHCVAELPRYMIPYGFHFFDKLPKNPNGKTDRIQLAAWATENLAA